MSGVTHRRRVRPPELPWPATALLLALLSLVPAAAGATVMESLGPHQLTRHASDVIEGEVLRQQVVEMDGKLWTEATVRVSRTHRGFTLPGVTVAVRHLGGELGRRGLRVAGTARMSVGERVVLFLREVPRPSAPPYHVVVGMCQGKYGVFRDTDGSERARRDLSGADFVRVPRAGQVVLSPTLKLLGEPTPTLQQLRRQIAAAMDALESASGGGGK